MAKAKISFNINGEPLFAPKLDSVEARFMADDNWIFVQGTKVGSGVWIRNYFNEDYPERSYIKAQAHVTKDGEIIHHRLTDHTYDALDGLSDDKLTQLGFAGSGNFFKRCNTPLESTLSHCSYGPTDIHSFLFSLNTAKREARTERKPKSDTLPIIKLF